MKNNITARASILAVSIGLSSFAALAADMSVTGSLCTGTDCASSESYGFDTIRLKENNVRIKFMDTSSSGSFPKRDWQLTANDSSNGGAEKFSIEDIDSGTVPFTVLGTAPSHSVYINSNGNVGMGTSAPALDLHVKGGNSPALRLEQDTSSGWAAQTWDIASNETNFFIRDVTNSSKLPFKIKPNAPTNSFYIAADGDIGLGTASPDGLLDIAHSSSGNNHAFLVSPTSNVGVNIDNGYSPLGLFDVQTTGGNSRFLVDANGNVGVGTSSPNGRFEIKSLDGSENLLSINDSGAFTLGTATEANYNGNDSIFTIEGFENQANTVTIESPSASYVSSLVFRKVGAAQWYLSSRNDYSSDRFVFFDNAVNEVLSLEQGGKIGFGVESVATANAIEHSNGARLTAGGVWTDASSRTLKNNIFEISTESALEALDELTPVTFNYKKQPDETYAGFIAEDVPDLVATNDRKSLAAMDIVAVLTKVVQEQQQQIAELNQRLAQLEASNVQ